MVGPMRNHPGKTHLGCLFSLFVLVAGVYVGINFIEVYWRFYKLQNVVKEQVTYATIVDDAVILRRLMSASDSLGLPLGRREWQVRRTGNPRQIVVSAQYQDSVVIEVLGLRKVFRIDFTPNASAPL